MEIDLFEQDPLDCGKILLFIPIDMDHKFFVSHKLSSLCFQQQTHIIMN